MNIRSIIISVCISALVSIFLGWGYFKYSSNKIGYIKSAIILRDYKGMMSTTEQFNNELKVVQKNLDTLRNRYESLKLREPLINIKEKSNWSYRLGIAQTEFEKYNEQASEQMQARRNELTNKVLETINNYIQTYGKEKKYKFILGTTEDGSILYANDGDDLTKEVLDDLNRLYDENKEKKK